MWVGKAKSWKILFPCVILEIDDKKIIKWINLQASLD